MKTRTMHIGSPIPFKKGSVSKIGNIKVAGIQVGPYGTPEYIIAKASSCKAYTKGEMIEVETIQGTINSREVMVKTDVSQKVVTEYFKKMGVDFKLTTK